MAKGDDIQERSNRFCGGNNQVMLIFTKDTGRKSCGRTIIAERNFSGSKLW